MNATADELVAMLSAQHARYFAKNPKGEIAQSLLIEREDGQAEIVACGWANPVERSAVIEWLREHMEAIKAVRYALWCEAWMKETAVPPGGSARAAYNKFERDYRVGDLARDPERREVVFTIVVEPGGKQTCRAQRIERGPDGAVTGLTPWGAGDELKGIGGALADLLPFYSIN